MTHAIQPHGGVLKDLVARDAPKAEELNKEARELNDIFLTEVSAPPSGNITHRQSFVIEKREMLEVGIPC